MGRARSQRRQDLAGEDADQRRDVAAQIELTLRTLILTAEKADLRFIGYLLRMAQHEAEDMIHKRVK